MTNSDLDQLTTEELDNLTRSLHQGTLRLWNRSIDLSHTMIRMTFADPGYQALLADRELTEAAARDQGELAEQAGNALTARVIAENRARAGA